MDWQVINFCILILLLSYLTASMITALQEGDRKIPVLDFVTMILMVGAYAWLS